jgi:predicted dinucleotide-binding enzyme
MKTIAVLGSGIVGRTLANGFIKHGYQVVMGTRNAEKLKEWADEARDRGHVDSFDKAAAAGDILVLAIKGTAAGQVLDMIKPNHLKGKIIIDTCNPIADEAPEDGVLKYFTHMNHSLMEQLQEKYSELKFVKSFSCVGSAFMINPDLPGGPPTMFICGDSDEAKEKVIEILGQFGWDYQDMGTSKAARAIEPLAMLWCIPGFRENNWMHAFKLLRN